MEDFVHYHKHKRKESHMKDIYEVIARLKERPEIVEEVEVVTEALYVLRMQVEVLTRENRALNYSRSCMQNVSMFNSIEKGLLVRDFEDVCGLLSQKISERRILQERFNSVEKKLNGYIAQMKSGYSR